MTSLRLLIGTFLVIVFSMSSVVGTPFDERADGPAVFAKCWNYLGVPDLSVSTSSDGTNVYFLDTDRRLHAIDLTSGEKLWSSDLGGTLASDIRAVGDSVYVVTQSTEAVGTSTSPAKLRSISTQTGITNWITELAVSGSISIGTFDGTVLTASAQGDIAAFSGATGHPIWNKNLGAALASRPAFVEDTALLATTNRDIFRIAESGDLSRIAKLDHLATALYSNPASGTLIGDERGNLIYLSAGDKRQWIFKNGARISHILPFDSEYIAASDDNFIYKLARSGDVEWKRRLSGRTAGGLVLAGNAVIASVVGDGEVYVIDARSGKIRNRIEIGEGVSAGLSAAMNKRAFVVIHPLGLTLYSQDKCAAK